MAITASMVAELRQKTSCGMMDCKKALQEADGDLELAIEILRKKGMAKAASKADRIAAQGIVKSAVSKDGHQAVLVEVNCETDFVARDSNFQEFITSVARTALSHQINDIEVLCQTPLDGELTVDHVRQELAAKLGENLQVRRVAFMQSDDILGVYVHGDRIGALVAMKGGDEMLAKDIAMHVVASKPQFITSKEVPAEVVAKEREICRAQALESGKPENIVEKIVDGRVQKFFDEVCLVNQAFVKNPDVSIQQLLKEKEAAVTAFVRMELAQ